MESSFAGSNYYVLIPEKILHNNKLSPFARLIYGELLALANINGFAWISNKKLAEKYDVTTRTITQAVSALEAENLLVTKLIYKSNSKEVERREIYFNAPMENNFMGVSKKSSIPYGKNLPYPIEKNFQDNNTVNNTINNNNNNNDISELINFYEGNFGVINQFTLDNITHDLNDYGKDLVMEAMKRSATNGKQYGYVRGILKNWGSSNVKTIHDVEVLDNSFKKTKQTSGTDDKSDWTWAEKKAGFREV